MPTYSAILDAEIAAEQPVTVSLMTRLRDNALAYAGAPTGTRAPWHQTAAPLGWTKDTSGSIHDRGVRLTTGTVGSGGNVVFSTCFSRTKTDPFTIPQTHLPNVTITVNIVDSGHIHPGGDLFDAVAGAGVNARNDLLGVSVISEASFAVNNTGGGNTDSATTGITASAPLGGGGNALEPGMDIRLAYHDLIIAVKD